MKEQTVFISAEVSKNGRDGKVSLNPDLIKLMLELKILDYPGGWFLFGENLMPGQEQAPEDIFNKTFAKVRKSLKFPDEIKFYSLKDSGIRDLGERAGIITARDQARHTDVATTNAYLQGRDREAPERAKTFKGLLHTAEEFPFEDR